MLNSKLKESKREIHKREKKEKAFQKSGRKQFERRDPQIQSKFSSKYKDRIESIKESDEKSRKAKKRNKMVTENKAYDLHFDDKYGSVLSKQETTQNKLFEAVGKIGIKRKSDIPHKENKEKISHF